MYILYDTEYMYTVHDLRCCMYVHFTPMYNYTYNVADCDAVYMYTVQVY